MATLIPEATIDSVRSTVNIVDYIGQYVSLSKAGQNLFGRCPFHEEKTPSFSVNEGKQIFKCFSCGRGGNVFQFVMDYDHVTFPEAVQTVAAYAHIDLGVQVGPSRPQEAPEVTRQKELLTWVQALSSHILNNTTQGEAALAYLQQRQLSEATITRFGIGYLPDDGTLVRQFLTEKGATPAEMQASGLFVAGTDGQLYDRFRDRVMFPLKDEYGAVIGFSGRVLSAESNMAKYLNSPETLLFKKSDVLFNLDQAKQHIRQEGVVLFEGFMDVIAAVQAGTENAIASMGTSLTPHQAKRISRMTQQVTVCYDGDTAGQHATNRALGLFAELPQVKASAVMLPDAMDPDEFIKARGAEAFTAQLAHPLSAVGYQLAYLSLDKDLTNEQDKLAFIESALRLIATVPTAAGQAVYLQQVAEQTGIPLASLSQSLPQSAPPVAVAPPPMAPSMAPLTQSLSRLDKAAWQLLAYAWQDLGITNRLAKQHFNFSQPELSALFDQWVAYVGEHDTAQLADFFATLPADLQATASTIAMQSLPEPSDEAITALVNLIGASSIKQQLSAVKQQMAQAQQLGDKAALGPLAQQYLQLTRQFKQMTQP